MTYLVSWAHSDTPECYALAWFRRQPAPDFPGGGFTIDVIGVCDLYPGPGGSAAIFASGAKISGGGVHYHRRSNAHPRRHRRY
jgi:hypothetical protein